MVRAARLSGGQVLPISKQPASLKARKKVDSFERGSGAQLFPKVETLPLGRAVSTLGARTWVAPKSSPAVAPLNIVDVRPVVDGGDFPVKRLSGETLKVSADVIKEGHDKLRARVMYGEPGQSRAKWKSVEMTYSSDQDEWSAEIPLSKLGTHKYAVEAFTDRFATWADFMSRKQKAGKDVASELTEGHSLILAAAKTAKGADRLALLQYANRLSDEDWPESARAAAALEPELSALMSRYEAPVDLTRSGKEYQVIVERERAQFGAWYELFPRSTSPVAGKHGTFADAAKRLPEIKQMGFDVVYLPPIHPIGETARKGKNNTEDAAKGDVGSPWAIGSKHGGHDAVHPELGTMKDFEAFVKKAGEQGLEVALDFAVQCAPDHPWVEEHPEWFKHRPDGTIAYAENPPKVYQDIVPIDLWCEDRDALWNALKDVLMGWIDRGVKIFRVDNPHTKPPAFWEWLIREVKEEHPDVIFLSEAFTKPKKQGLLTKLGFSQSYTYFTWKNSRSELEQYTKELVGEQAEHFRPNFFANTPDILPKYLQDGGKAAFELRYALAGLMSPSAGIYSGYELLENEALKGEDYLDSEKYQLKQRDFDAPENIKGFITKINAIRNENAALKELTNLTFHHPDNEQMLAFSKVSGDNKMLVVGNLDPHKKQAATLHLDGGALGLDENSTYKVHDLVSGESWTWKGLHNYVELDPSKRAPVHVFRIEPV